MSAPNGFVPITAANIQDAAANKLVAGTLEVLPTDGDDRPGMPSTAGGTGGPILTRPAFFTITNGAIEDNAWVADCLQTNPTYLSYRFTIRDATGLAIYVMRGVQPTVPGLNLDTYTSPATPAQAPREYGPQGPAGTITVGTVSPGVTAAIVNVGTPEAAVLNFTLPKGEQGIQGAAGANSQVGNLSGTFARQTSTADGSTAAFVQPVAGVPLVFRNGVLQDPGTDYTQLGTTVTMTSMPSGGDRITLVVLQAS